MQDRCHRFWWMEGMKGWQTHWQTGLEADRHPSRETEPEVARLHLFSIVGRFFLFDVLLLLWWVLLSLVRLFPFLFFLPTCHDKTSLIFPIYRLRKEKTNAALFFLHPFFFFSFTIPQKPSGRCHYSGNLKLALMLSERTCWRNWHFRSLIMRVEQGWEEQPRP